MLTIAKVHMSSLAIGLPLFSLSSFSIVFKAKTVELLPAPKILDIKLIIIEESICGLFCFGKIILVRGIKT